MVRKYGCYGAVTSNPGRPLTCAFFLHTRLRVDWMLMVDWMRMVDWWVLNEWLLVVDC